MYPSGYTCCYSTEIGISGIIHPISYYLYSQIIFNILARDSSNNNILAQVYNVPLQYDDRGSMTTSGPPPQLIIGPTRALPHNFVNPSVVAGNSSTLALTYYNFSFITDYSLWRYTKMYIFLPDGFSFINPTIIIITGQSQGIYFRYLWTPSSGKYIYCNIMFSDSGLPPNINISFQLINILNPYTITSNSPFKIYFTKYDGSDHYIYFQEESKLTVNIDTIGEFPLLEITSSSTTVSALTDYNFKFQLGYGNFNISDYIKIIVPNSIEYCDETTISIISGCLTDSISSDDQYKLSNFEYGFRSINCDNNNGSIVEFQMKCRNPQTLKPTDNLYLQTQSDINSDASIYYKSGISVTMTNTIPLSSIIVSYIQNNWINYPNTFSLSLRRTTPNISTQIDLIIINISPGMMSLDPVNCPNISALTGITGENIEISCTKDTIHIDKIHELS